MVRRDGVVFWQGLLLAFVGANSLFPFAAWAQRSSAEVLRAEYTDRGPRAEPRTRPVGLECPGLSSEEFPGTFGTRSQWNEAFRQVMLSFVSCQQVGGWNYRGDHCEEDSRVIEESLRARGGTEAPLCQSARRHFARCRAQMSGTYDENLGCPRTLRPGGELMRLMCERIREQPGTPFCYSSPQCPREGGRSALCFFSASGENTPDPEAQANGKMAKKLEKGAESERPTSPADAGSAR